MSDSVVKLMGESDDAIFLDIPEAEDFSSARGVLAFAPSGCAVLLDDSPTSAEAVLEKLAGTKLHHGIPIERASAKGRGFVIFSLDALEIGVPYLIGNDPQICLCRDYKNNVYINGTKYPVAGVTQQLPEETSLLDLAFPLPHSSGHEDSKNSALILEDLIPPYHEVDDEDTLRSSQNGALTLDLKQEMKDYTASLSTGSARRKREKEERLAKMMNSYEHRVSTLEADFVALSPPSSVRRGGRARQSESASPHLGDSTQRHERSDSSTDEFPVPGVENGNAPVLVENREVATAEVGDCDSCVVPMERLHPEHQPTGDEDVCVADPVLPQHAAQPDKGENGVWNDEERPVCPLGDECEIALASHYVHFRHTRS